MCYVFSRDYIRYVLFFKIYILLKDIYKIFDIYNKRYFYPILILMIMYNVILSIITKRTKLH